MSSTSYADVLEEVLNKSYKYVQLNFWRKLYPDSHFKELKMCMLNQELSIGKGIKY